MDPVRSRCLLPATASFCVAASRSTMWDCCSVQPEVHTHRLPPAISPLFSIFSPHASGTVASHGFEYQTTLHMRFILVLTLLSEAAICFYALKSGLRPALLFILKDTSVGPLVEYFSLVNKVQKVQFIQKSLISAPQIMNKYFLVIVVVYDAENVIMGSGNTD